MQSSKTESILPYRDSLLYVESDLKARFRALASTMKEDKENGNESFVSTSEIMDLVFTLARIHDLQIAEVS